MKSVFCGLLLSLIVAVPAHANYVDAKGRVWRKMDRTSLVASASGVRQVCAQDPCSGSLGGVDLTGYTWASAEDVEELINEFDPNASGGYFAAQAFSHALGITFMFNTTYTMNEGTFGLTSSIDQASGLPLVGYINYGHNMVSIDGSLRIATGQDAAQYGRSVFLYKKDNVVVPPAPKDCSLNGVTVAHATSVIRWKASSVAYGQSCLSEQRTCNDGVLSGSFAALSCTVQPKPPVVVDCSKIKNKKDRKKCEDAQKKPR